MYVHTYVIHVWQITVSIGKSLDVSPGKYVAHIPTTTNLLGVRCTSKSLPSANAWYLTNVICGGGGMSRNHTNTLNVPSGFEMFPFYREKQVTLKKIQTLYSSSGPSRYSQLKLQVHKVRVQVMDSFCGLILQTQTQNYRESIPQSILHFIVDHMYTAWHMASKDL